MFFLQYPCMPYLPCRSLSRFYSSWSAFSLIFFGGVIHLSIGVYGDLGLGCPFLLMKMVLVYVPCFIFIGRTPANCGGGCTHLMGFGLLMLIPFRCPNQLLFVEYRTLMALCWIIPACLSAMVHCLLNSLIGLAVGH